jgi:hypothetical protein
MVRWAGIVTFELIEESKGNGNGNELYLCPGICILSYPVNANLNLENRLSAIVAAVFRLRICHGLQGYERCYF